MIRHATGCIAHHHDDAGSGCNAGPRADSPPILVGGQAAARFQFDGTPVHPLCVNMPLDSSLSDPKSLSECTNRRITPTAGRDGSWEAHSKEQELGISYRVLANKGDRFLLATDS